MDSKLQDALQRANNEVEISGITDPELRKIAFSKAVDYYLNEPQVTLNSSEIMEPPKNIESVFWNSLSSAAKIDEAKLRDIYSLKGNQVLLIVHDIPGNLKTDRQRSLAALILFAYQEGMKSEWVVSTLLSEAAKNSGLYDTSKFAKNLNYSWFRSTGKKKGVRYKLSGPGVGAAMNLLKIEVAKLSSSGIIDNTQTS
jgi:hypothetical protein